MPPPSPVMSEELQVPETNTELEADPSETTDEGQQTKNQAPPKHQSVGHQQFRNNHHHQQQQFSRQSGGIQKNNRNKTTFKRIDVDPSRRYHTPEARESWGPNVKGKKFRKEKGKKKRSTGTGARIDGSVRSVRLDA